MSDVALLVCEIMNSRSQEERNVLMSLIVNAKYLGVAVDRSDLMLGRTHAERSLVLYPKCETCVSARSEAVDRIRLEDMGSITAVEQILCTLARLCEARSASRH